MDPHILFYSGSETIVLNGVNNYDRELTKNRFRFVEDNTQRTTIDHT